MKTYPKNILIIVSVLMVVSCQKLNELTQFDLKYNSKVTISPIFSINTPFEVLTPDVTTNAESEFSSHGTAKDYIDQIKLSNINLKITSPSTQKFDFLKSVDVIISATGLSDTKIAQKQDISDTVGNELSLDVQDNDIAEFIKKDKFKLKVKVVTDKTVSNEIQIDVNSIFRVKAKLF